MSEFLTKVHKFEIIKPTNCDWDTFGAVLRDLSFKSARMANLVVTNLWHHDMQKIEYKNKHGEYPSIKEPNLYQLTHYVISLSRSHSNVGARMTTE